MDFFNVFRGFFGLPSRNDGSHGPGFRNPITGDDGDDDDEGILDDDYRFDDRQSPFGFNIFTGDVLEMHRFFEKQFDEIMKNFHSNWFGMEGPQRIPAIDQPEYFDDNPRSKFVKPEYLEPPSKSSDRNHADIFNNAPGNNYLKPAFVEPPLDPKAKKDTDIDNKLDPSQVLDLFLDKNDKNRIEPYSSKPQMRFSSQAIKKRVLPNGGLEEERKCISNGKEEVTISRQLGDMKHIITTVKYPDGTTEKSEEFINLDEGKLPNFNKAWGSSASSVPKSDQRQNTNGEIMIPDRFSLFELFSKFIP